jgi:hypothetical protein
MTDAGRRHRPAASKSSTVSVTPHPPQQGKEVSAMVLIVLHHDWHSHRRADVMAAANT